MFSGLLWVLRKSHWGVSRSSPPPVMKTFACLSALYVPIPHRISYGKAALILNKVFKPLNQIVEGLQCHVRIWISLAEVNTVSKDKSCFTMYGNSLGKITKA